MAHYDPPRGQGGQPAGAGPGQSGAPPTADGTPAGQPGAAQRPRPPAEQSVSTPTLRWVSMAHPQEAVPLGEDDHVLDSVYNPSADAWEVLVLVQPGEEEVVGEEGAVDEEETTDEEGEE